MKLKIFTKAECPNCPPAKAIGLTLEEEGHDVMFYNLDDVDGLTESIMYDVIATPTIVVVDDNGKEIKSWRSIIPHQHEIRDLL